MAVGTDPGRYRELKPLGSGGMGQVTLAEDELLGRQVALKRLRSDNDVAALARLRREALLGASLNHPNLVSVFDVITEADGGVVVVMEYVPGRTLAAALAGSGGLSPAEALRILAALAAGLDAIHAQGIVHRDVKPANVLLGEDGAVKLADLGIAAVSDATRITSAGTVLGSWRYMAPEQLEGERSSPAIDIYALAAVAYEALSGHAARREQNPLALAHAIATQPPPDLRRDWPTAPAAAAAVLSAGMARDPAARPASAQELVGQLKEALVPSAVSASPAAAAAVAPAVAAAPRPRVMAPRRVPPPRRVASPPAAGSPRTPRFSGPPSSRRSGRWIAALLAVLAAAVVVAAVVSSGGSGGAPARQASASTHAAWSTKPAASGSASAQAKTATSSAATTAAGAAHASGPAPGPASAGSPASRAAAGGAAPPAPGGTGAGGAPAATVQRFYTLAAAHQYAPAWSLADPAFRSQLGGYPSFEAGQSGDRSITFDSLRTTAQSADLAAVSLTTTSVRTSGTEHCAGTADLVRNGPTGSWLMHQIHIACS